jgi:hypothetical protein
MRYRRWFAGAALALLALAFGMYFIDRSSAGGDRSETIWPPARGQPTIVPATDEKLEPRLRYPIPNLLPKHEPVADGSPVAAI